MKLTLQISSLVLAGLVGCAPPSEAVAKAPTSTHAAPACDDHQAPPVPIRSPGGTPELSPAEVRAAACKLRIIDIRERKELDAELGVIAGAEHVSSRRIAVEALSWDRAEPIVLVCRSGRRSGTATRALEELGFTKVASMTGGMLAWNAAHLPVADGPSIVAPPPPDEPVPTRALSLVDVEDHIANRDRVRWTKAANLMLHGTQACVDGRDAHAIIGTPGGDAGELVLALASAERVGARTFTTAEVEALFDAYLDAFGHFYMHTDDHAVAEVLEALELDLDDPSAAASFVQAPPPAMHDALLEALVAPAHVGCGHLRLMLQHSEEYGVREALVTDVMRAFYRRLWAGNPALEFVVLQGAHAESAVVSVELAHAVHGYTRIPLISPRIAAHEVFVIHPQVAHFVRTQNTSFLLEQGSWDVEIGEERFLNELEALAASQLQATVSYLAADLPHFRVAFSKDGERFDVSKL